MTQQDFRNQYNISQLRADEIGIALSEIPEEDFEKNRFNLKEFIISRLGLKLRNEIDYIDNFTEAFVSFLNHIQCS